jgi:hypothetical protein
MTVALYGDLKHASDPRGKIENITGEGDFVWVMDEGKETGPDSTAPEIKWTVKGGDQEWTFTRLTRMKGDNEAVLKNERFWITILKADGVWVTRVKYRYKEGETGEVEKKDKGGKYKASCRITGGKIILAAFKKNRGHIFKITKKDGLMRVNLVTTHDLRDWTRSFKKQ